MNCRSEYSDFRLLVRQHACTAREGRGADAVGTRRVFDEGTITFARRDARSDFERARDRIAGVDDGVGIIAGLRVDQLQGGGGNELQRFSQRGLRAEAADLCAGVAQDEQGALEIIVGVIFGLSH